MFLIRDFSKENLKKQGLPCFTLRTCTSEKKFPIYLPTNDYIRVGSYKYRQQDMLGKGFSSKVYKASHLNNSDEKYAIKVINLKKFKASNHAMLESQIEVHRTLNHPNIVKFYDAYKTTEYFYIITQYCPNGDLMELLNHHKKIDENKAQNIIQQIIDGYNYLSKKNILHRDLKPANIFRSGQTWKIGDFGFSIYCRGEYFVDKINVGTPLYMPPQALKSNKYSFKSDIFAIGIILYEMLTSRTPWQCKTEKQLMNKMKFEQIIYPQFKNQKLKKFISKACDVNESDRLPIKDLHNFFSESINPQEKQADKVLNRNPISLKSIRDSCQQFSSDQLSKNTTQTSLNSNKNIQTLKSDESTEISQLSDHNNRNKCNETYRQKNNKLLLQQLQFCRLIYYMTKNIKYFPLNDPKTKSFISLTLFKHLLRCIKQLENPNINFPNQLISFDTYQYDQQYKQLQQQIKNYSKRYEKQYLDVLKITQISIIRSVNKKFPELSYNSPLVDQFYKSYYQYFYQILRLINHEISTNQQSQPDPTILSASYQSLYSIYWYCTIIKQKQSSYQLRKIACLSNFNQQFAIDYRQSKLEKKDYLNLRQKLKNM